MTAVTLCGLLVLHPITEPYAGRIRAVERYEAHYWRRYAEISQALIVLILDQHARESVVQ